MLILWDIAFKKQIYQLLGYKYECEPICPFSEQFFLQTLQEIGTNATIAVTNKFGKDSEPSDKTITSEAQLDDDDDNLHQI